MVCHSLGVGNHENKTCTLGYCASRHSVGYIHLQEEWVMSPVVLNILLAVVGVGAYTLGHFGILPANIVNIVLGLMGWPLISAAAVKVQQVQVQSTLKSLQVPTTPTSNPSASVPLSDIPSSSFTEVNVPLRSGRQLEP